MKKINYVYLTIGIALFALWVVDLLSFFKMTEIWEMARGLYGITGWCLAAGFILEGWPTTEDNETKRICDLCGNKIMKNEKSIHYLNKDNGTTDYCEKCTDKIIK
jgi:hypothetical protein